ncbi:MAG: hypothetical protein ACTSW7_00900 [Candidatus Thorarchaeota archaeon]
MPLEEEKKTEDKFFIIEFFAYMEVSKEFSLRRRGIEDGYYVEFENKMTIGIHLKDMNDDIECLMQTRISGQMVGLSFLLSNIEATARVADVLLGEVVTIELRW